MSSNPYARRPDLPMPISTSATLLPPLPKRRSYFEQQKYRRTPQLRSTAEAICDRSTTKSGAERSQILSATDL
jgi:hypothetical protein